MNIFIHNLRGWVIVSLFTAKPTTAIESARFKKIVVPGDQLIIKAKLLKFKLNTCKIGATIHVNKELVAESTFLASVVNRSI